MGARGIFVTGRCWACREPHGESWARGAPAERLDKFSAAAMDQFSAAAYNELLSVTAMGIRVDGAWTLIIHGTCVLET